MKPQAYLVLIASLLVTGCPSPVVDPIPTTAPPSSVEPSNPPDLNDLSQFTVLDPLYKIEFGPGTKGPKDNFGPGTKGPKAEFGPGTKGPKNLTLNINLPESLVQADLADFTTLQARSTQLELIQIELIRENLLYATISVKPKQSKIVLETSILPDVYTVKVQALGNFQGEAPSFWSQLEIKTETNAELRVELYPDPFRPEDLDIGVLSRNDIQRPAAETPIPEVASASSP